MLPNFQKEVAEFRQTSGDRERPDWRSSHVSCLHYSWVIWSQAETPPPPVSHLLTHGCHHLPKSPEEPSGWSQNSSWPCLNRLTPLLLRRLLGFALWEAPVSPYHPTKLPQNPLKTPSPSPKQPSSFQGASKSSPGAGSFRGFLSIRLAFPEVLMTETGTKEALSGEFRGRMGKGDRY